jgi:hypothetical protein
MNLGEDWTDWTGKLGTALPISSALDRAIISKWDALGAYDSWAGVEAECMVIEDLALPQDHNFLSAHTDYNPFSFSSLSFEEETRLRRITMPEPPPTFLSSFDPALCNPNGEGPDPLVSPPPNVSSSLRSALTSAKGSNPPLPSSARIRVKATTRRSRNTVTT